MRYKKGDKVTITMKHLREDQMTPNGLFVDRAMIDMEGEVHVIKIVRPGTIFNRYSLEGNEWIWDEWCFEETDEAMNFAGVEELIL